jgi:uncharacterized protein
MMPPRHPRRDIPALVFVHLFPLLMAWLYLVVLRGSAGAPSSAMAVVFGIAKVVQFTFPALYVWRFEPSRLRPTLPSTRGLAWGVGFGLLVASAMFGLYFGWLKAHPLFAETPGKVNHLLQEMHCDGPTRYALLAAAYAVGHSFLEEYYWRWFAFGWLRRYVPTGLAIPLSALGFTAHHVVLLAVYFPGRWPLVLALSFGVMAGGMVWAWIYERSGSLYAAWISHGLIDAAIYVVGYAMVAPLWATSVAGGG